MLAGRLTRSNSRPTVRKKTYKCYIFPFSTNYLITYFLKPTPDAGGTLAAVIVLACETGLLNSASGDSHGHGRVVPTATDGHFWEQGIPNGTGGISSIFKAHLGAEWGGGRRTTSSGRSVGIRIVYTDDWDVNEQEDSSKEIIHARQLVPAGEVYLLLPKYCCRSSISSDCRANTTEAPINLSLDRYSLCDLTTPE